MTIHLVNSRVRQSSVLSVISAEFVSYKCPFFMTVKTVDHCHAVVEERNRMVVQTEKV